MVLLVFGGERVPSPMPDPVFHRLTFARQLADAADELVMRYYQSHALAVDTKRDGSPVTTADREAEQLIRAAVAQQFPDDGVLGEEFGETPGRSEFRWIIDPIDGTKAFVCGVPLFGSLIAVEHLPTRRAVVGVISIPAMGERVSAASGVGATYHRQGRDVGHARVSRTASLEKAVFTYTEPRIYHATGTFSTFDELSRRAYTARGWSDAYGFLLVATGRSDVHLEPELKIWDVAAPAAVLAEAGGRCTSWTGEDTIHASTAMASNGHLHDEVLRVIASKR